MSSFPPTLVTTTLLLCSACVPHIDGEIEMNFERPELFSAPFPAQDLFGGGRDALDRFPGIDQGTRWLSDLDPLIEKLSGVDLMQEAGGELFFVAEAIASVRHAEGYDANAGYFFRVTFDDDPNPRPADRLIDLDVVDKYARGWNLPARDDTVDEDSPVFLINVDENSESFGTRYPIDVDFSTEHAPYRPRFLLSMVPWQGKPLDHGALHAAVVMRHIRSPWLRRSKTVEALRNDEPVTGLEPTARYDFDVAIKVLRSLEVDLQQVAALTVVSTDRPFLSLQKGFEAAQRDGLRTGRRLTLVEESEYYCVYKGTLLMPNYQRGIAPYFAGGGDWVMDEEGELVMQHRAESNVRITLPRQPMPKDGYPSGVFIRTGGGGDRPLIDRGVTDKNENELHQHQGPAFELSKIGFVGVSVDGPHGGLRNVQNTDEQILMFNFINPKALRDNVRQSAIEQALIPAWLRSLRFDTSDCIGAANETTFDEEHFALIGHSMGASIAPLTAALQPDFEAIILSGAGASWIENVLNKKEPFALKQMAELLIDYYPGELDRYDPALSLVQWAAGSADSINYGRYLLSNPDTLVTSCFFKAWWTLTFFPRFPTRKQLRLALIQQARCSMQKRPH